MEFLKDQLDVKVGNAESMVGFLDGSIITMITMITMIISTMIIMAIIQTIIPRHIRPTPSCHQRDCFARVVPHSLSQEQNFATNAEQR